MDIIRAAGEFAVDLVYPKRCAGCGRRGIWLCAECDAHLPRFAPPWCSGCGVPLSLDRCQCQRTPDVLAATRSVGPFDGWLKNAIVQFKYHGEWARAEPLSEPLADAINDILPCDALVPVPLHPKRFRKRGFNQSQLLARHVARQLGLEVCDAVTRARNTVAQATLSAGDRPTNVEAAFVCSAMNIEGMSLLLIDDVITTGSTLAACANALIVAGAKSVSAATIAREL
jgi:competence protein ComFC